MNNNYFLTASKTYVLHSLGFTVFHLTMYIYRYLADKNK